MALFLSSLAVSPLAFLLTLAVGPLAFPLALTVGPLAFLLALLLVALACLLALPFLALCPLLIRLQITLQCSKFYVSSPIRVLRRRQTSHRSFRGQSQSPVRWLQLLVTRPYRL